MLACCLTDLHCGSYSRLGQGPQNTTFGDNWCMFSKSLTITQPAV